MKRKARTRSQSSSRVFLAPKGAYPLVVTCIPDGHPTIERIWNWEEVTPRVRPEAQP
jgi:hypothetical protein